MSQVGKQATPFELKEVEDNVDRLSDFHGRWLLLVFHRHLGGLACREHLTQLRQHEQKLIELGMEVAVVTFDADFTVISSEQIPDHR